MSTRTQARVYRESCSTPGAIGPSASSLGNCSIPQHLAQSRVVQDACRNCGPLGMGLSRLKGGSTPQTLRLGPESPAKGDVTAGFRTLARVSRDSWPNPRALGPRPEWPETAGRTRGPSDMGLSHPTQLVDTEGLQTRAPVARNSWLNTRALARKREWPGRAGRTRRPSELGRSPLGQLVDPVGPRNWTGFAWEHWSTPGAPRPSLVAWDRCLTPWHLGHGPESPWMQVKTVAPREQA